MKNAGTATKTPNRCQSLTSCTAYRNSTEFANETLISLIVPSSRNTSSSTKATVELNIVAIQSILSAKTGRRMCVSGTGNGDGNGLMIIDMNYGRISINAHRANPVGD